MANINDYKVTNKEVKENGVQSILETVLVGDPDENKKLFDKLVTLLINKYNDALDFISKKFGDVSDTLTTDYRTAKDQDDIDKMDLRDVQVDLVNNNMGVTDTEMFVRTTTLHRNGEKNGGKTAAAYSKVKRATKSQDGVMSAGDKGKLDSFDPDKKADLGSDGKVLPIQLPDLQNLTDDEIKKIATPCRAVTVTVLSKTTPYANKEKFTIRAYAYEGVCEIASNVNTAVFEILSGDAELTSESVLIYGRVEFTYTKNTKNTSDDLWVNPPYSQCGFLCDAIVKYKANGLSSPYICDCLAPAGLVATLCSLSSNTITFPCGNIYYSALPDGYIISIQVNKVSLSSAVCNFSYPYGGSKKIKYVENGNYVDFSANKFKTNVTYLLSYNTSENAWIVISPQENVKPDWNAPSGSIDEIKNKPDLSTKADLVSGTVKDTQIPNATETTVGGVKARIDGNTLYLTSDGSNP